MTSTRSDDPRSVILWTIAMVAIAVIVLWAAYLARTVLLMGYVSALFAIGFSPLVRWIETQKLLPIGTRLTPRWLAILLIYLAIVSIVTLAAMLVMPPLVAQARELARALPEMFQRAQTYLISKGFLDHRLTVGELVQRAPGTDAVGTAFSAVTGFVGGVFGVLTILILTFYMLIESETLFDTFVRLFPRQRRAQFAAASRQVTVKVSGWLLGQLLLGVTIGVTAGIGLWLLGVPYFYVLALIAGIGEMIPVVGPILSAIPAVAVALTVSPQKALLVLIFWIVQQQIENHVLVPKILSRQVGVSAVTVIVALLLGGSLLGIVGALLAVPTAAILQVVLQELGAAEPPREAGAAR
ncbi:MAG: AI-2E family transporter [Acidobacteria bacterium]|nr:AI-2E family transporter [Acidobacteriota bacterium]